MCMRADVQHTRMDAHACSRSRAKTGLRALFDDGVAGVCHGRVERRLVKGRKLVYVSSSPQNVQNDFHAVFVVVRRRLDRLRERRVAQVPIVLVDVAPLAAVLLGVVEDRDRLQVELLARVHDVVGAQPAAHD